VIRTLVCAALLALSTAPALAAPALAAPAGAAPAQPVGECIWSRLPDAEQQAVLAGYKAGMGEGMEALKLRYERLMAEGRACTGRPDAPPALLQAAITAVVIQHGAGLYLLEQWGVPRNILDRLWREAPPAARDCTRFEAAKPLNLAVPACPDKEQGRWFLGALEVERTDRKGATEALTYYYGAAHSELAEGLLAKFIASRQAP
jgi:hypothetical protein